MSYSLSNFRNLKSTKCFMLSFYRHNRKIARKQTPEMINEIPSLDHSTKDAHVVYTWGNAKAGALGHRYLLRPLKKGQHIIYSRNSPERLEFFDQKSLKCIDLDCGYGFTMFVAKNRATGQRLYGTGYNHYSQLGRHEPRPGHPLEFIIQPVPIHLPLQDSKTKVLKVACGRSHALILTDKEGVLSIGHNGFGQCGYPIVEDEKYVGRVNRINSLDDDIVEVVCGLDHSIFRSKDGKLYSCGWGADGQTGLGHYDNQGIPQLIKGDIEGENIIQVASSADCVLAINDKGDVFGWGNSEYGQLGPRSNQQNSIPRHLSLKIKGKVVQAAVGGSSSFLLNDAGDVFTWGFGTVGMGPENQLVASPTLMPPPLFGRNEFNPDSKVTQIYATAFHSAAVTSVGDLFMWGKNRSGCLGQSKKKLDFLYFPLRVNISRGKVIKVGLGIDHTAVLTK